MTMRYVHPAAEQKRTAAEKFEKFSAEGMISAAALQQRRRVTTKVTITRERELMTTTAKSLKELVAVMPLPLPWRPGAPVPTTHIATATNNLDETLAVGH
jgi:hypothetical protein